MPTKAWGARAAHERLGPLEIERRRPGPRDIQIDILWCGVCHSDLHTVRAEWRGTRYPCVPGHEIIGRVTAHGDTVTTFAIGDTVGVGCMVGSCQDCSACAEGLEQYCENGFVGTYNGLADEAPGHTLGGYAKRIVVDEKFVLRITHPEERLAAAAPLLCAGITTWSPLRHWGVGPGKKVGIVGVGGLGHMGIKLAKALGAHVVAFTTSEDKRADARSLGADEVVVSRNPAEMEERKASLDFILNTVSVSHDLDDYIRLLKRDGTMTLVGAPEHPHPSPKTGQLVMGRRSLAGSLIGGIAETQEMLDFCAERGIVSEVEIIPVESVDEAYDRMVRSDVRYRFVIDIASLGD